MNISKLKTYIGILRGINVGGKILKMADLKKMFQKLGFKNVNTYIQSGNVFFQYRHEETRVLEQTIQNRIKTDFGTDVPVIVLTPDKLERIIEVNPFKANPVKEKTYLHVTFLQTKPVNYDKESVLDKKAGKEEIAFTDEAVYLYCPHGYGSSKLNNNLFENKLKVTATTRNWKTTLKLLELAQSIS